MIAVAVAVVSKILGREQTGSCPHEAGDARVQRAETVSSEVHPQAAEAVEVKLQCLLAHQGAEQQPERNSELRTARKPVSCAPGMSSDQVGDHRAEHGKNDQTG